MGKRQRRRRRSDVVQTEQQLPGVLFPQVHAGIPGSCRVLPNETADIRGPVCDPPAGTDAPALCLKFGMDEMEKRKRELYAELRDLMRRVHRVNMELNDIERGVKPPERNDEEWIPPFIRSSKETLP